ncbi:MAG: hypothetical protein ACRYFR_05355 [Janthinobacterium lividum]
MASVLHSSASAVHLVAALGALAAGTYVLLKPKGTRAHRWVGWGYVASMAVLLVTAFRIYFLFGRFGVVHWGAVGSATALLVGVGAAVLRPPGPAWLGWHYFSMSASVTGLYAAFAAESTYRFFALTYFWWATLGPASAVLVVGGVLLCRRYPAWKAAFAPA